MLVAKVPSYVSLLAIPIISSPVRVSKISTLESVYETTKFSPDGLRGEMQVGETPGTDSRWML
jgi:hypothetical protein